MPQPVMAGGWRWVVLGRGEPLRRWPQWPGLWAAEAVVAEQPTEAVVAEVDAALRVSVSATTTVATSRIRLQTARLLTVRGVPLIGITGNRRYFAGRTGACRQV